MAALEAHAQARAGSAWVYIDEWGKLRNHYRSWHKMPAVLRELTFYGRHWGMTAIICPQRPYLVHPDVRNNCRNVVAFWMPGDSDRAVIADMCPVPLLDGRKPKEAIMQLQKRQAYIFKGREVIRYP